MNPILSNEFLHVGYRLTRAPLKEDSKHPFTLPNKHITDMIFRDCHESWTPRREHVHLENIIGKLRVIVVCVGLSKAVLSKVIPVTDGRLSKR